MMSFYYNGMNNADIPIETRAKLNSMFGQIILSTIIAAR